MKTSLVIFGVIFLVIGGLLYFVPTQELKADTTSIGNGDVDKYTSFARVSVPIGWAYASAIIGFILLVLGLLAPNAAAGSDSYEEVVESKENSEGGDENKRKIVRKRTERHKAR